MNTQAQTQKTLKTGDIFYTSWGYEQTNIDFYEVVSITKSGKTAVFAKLKANKIECDMVGSTTPKPHVFDKRSEPFKKRIQYNDKGDFWMRLDGRVLWPWDGKAKRFTTYG